MLCAAISAPFGFAFTFLMWRGCVQAGVAGAVASFMLQDLRRFQMYDSSATRPLRDLRDRQLQARC